MNFFLSFFCLSIPKRDLNTKKTPPNIEVCPESSRATLVKNIDIAVCQTWPIVHSCSQEDKRSEYTAR